MDITLYHNPRCSKSRATLERIRARGIEPRIVEYLAVRARRAQLWQVVLSKDGIPGGYQTIR